MDKHELTTRDEMSNFLLYTSPQGDVKVEVILGEETVWLSQKLIGELFGVSKSTISEHLSNIYAEGELEKSATVRKIRTVQIEGQRQVERLLDHYNLDAIISVGYRVNSAQATQFRIWATKLLREYIIKGFAMDDERLKNGRYFGKDYFRELLERVRSIRASKSPIFSQNAVWITTPSQKRHATSMPTCRISFISPSPARPQQKLFTKMQTHQNR